jgi:hypothetical protein
MDAEQHALAFEALDRTASAHFIGGIGSSYQRVAPVMPHKPIVPAGAPGELRLAQACLRAGVDAIRPGIEARTVEAPALVVLRDAGFGDGFSGCGFGYGVGCRLPANLARLVPDHTYVRPEGATRHHVRTPRLPARRDRPGRRRRRHLRHTESGIELLAGAGSIDLYTT